MKSALDRRLKALEAPYDPAQCLNCAIHRLNQELGEPPAGAVCVVPRSCTHPGKALSDYIAELDAAIAKGVEYAH